MQMWKQSFLNCNLNKTQRRSLLSGSPLSLLKDKRLYRHGTNECKARKQYRFALSILAYELTQFDTIGSPTTAGALRLENVSVHQV